MSASDTNHYTRTAKILHWLVALIILGLLSVGFLMGMMEYSPLKLNIYMLHKSFGMSVLGLVIVRILWRAYKKPPASLPSHAKWEKNLAHIIHALLYVGMIGMPLSGWVMSSAGEYPVSFFGLFEFPAITAKNEQLLELSQNTHEIFAYMLIAGVGLHFLGAAKHHIIDRDFTLRRMGGNFTFLLIGGVLLLGASTLAGNNLLKGESHDEHSHEQVNHEDSTDDSAHDYSEEPATAPQSLSARSGVLEPFQWVINLEDSKVAFEFLQSGAPVRGEFKDFDGRIIFDAQNPQNSEVNIVIDPTSIQTGSKDRDLQAQSESWFSVMEFPIAVFKAESITPVEPNQYTARGDLTIRGTTIPVVMPFSLEISKNDTGGESALMRAQISLMRLDFAIGQGEWESTQTIDNNVNIDIELHATRPVLAE